ncbi:4'-phosphopantetheinyl transferase superfamily protein [Streptomyces sp. FIT100]|uniref:4'-phosphopantetheinyl transferase family protein n=1 Tax=Streptomyces sp. FIT100 TaxID=2837956 RepID=UPI0021C5FD18|nr:4'-phosphopantetheinyl transferase superfamily protein [Streptomyces sp. FIT100]UUN29218.1 4'-phosphopantetheinyl transferase superfamily protein [Streptomyces sp. FIT100]
MPDPGAGDADAAGIALLGPGECHVWSAEARWAPELLDVLDERERERCAQFRHDGARALYLTAHVLARRTVGVQLGVDPRDVVFVPVCKNCRRPQDPPHGKPTLPGTPLELSLSHSGTRAMVALTTVGPVGVDIEEIAARAGLPLDVLSAPERAELDRLPEAARPPAFIRYWARKEAVLKATGDGLMVDPATLTVTGPDAPAGLVEWRERPEPHLPVRLEDLAVGDGYRAAVAVVGDGDRVRMVRQSDVRV